MNTTAIASPTVKVASPDHPINELLAKRWSPYAFSDRPVADADLVSLFEAARWSASSYNEQPWAYFIATAENQEEFARLLSCLVPSNQVWAKAAPVLILTVVSQRFSKSQDANRAALHDLGQASANLSLEATARGLSVHQMIGIFPDRARELYQIPENFDAWTAMAVGYAGNGEAQSGALQDRDRAPRERKPAGDFVFTGAWGKPASLFEPPIVSSAATARASSDPHPDSIHG